MKQRRGRSGTRTFGHIVRRAIEQAHGFGDLVVGYTINRVTLFALILVTGIVIDATIIVVENMHRHFQIKGNNSLKTALGSIQEVGNPTILATLTVIGALLPMGAVTGMMGPYMLPIPVLDGGHLVFLSIEAVRGKPLSEQGILWAQKIGIALLGTLMIFVFYNDIARIVRQWLAAS